MATQVKVKLYSNKEEGGFIALASVPVDGKTRQLTELFTPNRPDKPDQIIGDMIYVVHPPPDIEVTLVGWGTKPLKLKDEPQRIGADGANVSAYSLSAKKTG